MNGKSLLISSLLKPKPKERERKKEAKLFIEAIGALLVREMPPKPLVEDAAKAAPVAPAPRVTLTAQQAGAVPTADERHAEVVCVSMYPSMARQLRVDGGAPGWNEVTETSRRR